MGGRREEGVRREEEEEEDERVVMKKRGVWRQAQVCVTGKRLELLTGCWVSVCLCVSVCDSKRRAAHYIGSIFPLRQQLGNLIIERHRASDAGRGHRFTYGEVYNLTESMKDKCISSDFLPSPLNILLRVILSHFAITYCSCGVYLKGIRLPSDFWTIHP